MTASFVKLFMGDNAKLLTDYNVGTDYHTLKVSGDLGGGGGGTSGQPTGLLLALTKAS